MTKRTERQYLGDMLDYARKAVELVQTNPREEFDRNHDLQDALSYRILVIGEAAYHLSTATKERLSRSRGHA